MALPNVTIYSLPAGNASTIALSQGATSSALQLNGTLGTSALGVLGANQQRITVTSAANDSGIGFRIVGLNQAGFTVSEVLTGGNATAVQSGLDYRTVISIAPVTLAAGIATTTASTVTAGTNGVGSSLWNIMNWHVAPVNIEVSGVVQGTTAVNYSIQYTYDDPNNLPAGVQFPQPFSHPTINNATTTLDGPINDPVTGIRLLINSGTGTVRMTVIQAGLSQGG